MPGLTVYYSSDKGSTLSRLGRRHLAPAGGRRNRIATRSSSSTVPRVSSTRLRSTGSSVRSLWRRRSGSRRPPRQPPDTLRVEDRRHGVAYETKRGLLGVRVLDLRTKQQLYVARFKGFTWNPRFGPDPPTHGLSLAPDRPELWALDAPNSVVHLFDERAPGPRRRAGSWIFVSRSPSPVTRAPVRRRAVASGRSSTARTGGSSTSGIPVTSSTPPPARCVANLERAAQLAGGFRARLGRRQAGLSAAQLDSTACTAPSCRRRSRRRPAPSGGSSRNR